MKFYSEKLKKFYDTQDECQTAEVEFEEAQAKKEAEKKAVAAARSERAKEVEAAYKTLVNARKEYNAKLAAFCKDYGAFHMTINGLEEDPIQLISHFWDF